MISVETIMSPDPIKLSPDDTLGTAHDLMNEKHIHHIPIVEKDGSLVGLISHRDILAASGSILRSNPTDNSQRKIKEIMTAPVASIPLIRPTLRVATKPHAVQRTNTLRRSERSWRRSQHDVIDCTSSLALRERVYKTMRT